MKNIRHVFPTLLILFCFGVNAQFHSLDSLKSNLLNLNNDSNKVFTDLRISVFYFDSKRDSCIHYAEEALNLSQKLNFDLGKVQSMGIIANELFETGNYVKSLEMHLEVLKIREKINDISGIGSSDINIARVYQKQKDYKNAIYYYLKAKEILGPLKNKDLVIDYIDLGDNYETMNIMDSSLYYQNAAYELALLLKDDDDIGTILCNLGNIHYKMGNNDLSLSHYRSSIITAANVKDFTTLSDANIGISIVFLKIKQIDSSILYAKKSLVFARQINYPEGVLKASKQLAQLFEGKGKLDSAYIYFKSAMGTGDTLFNAEIVRKVEIMNINEQLRQQDLIQMRINASIDRKNHLQMLAVVIFIILLFSLLIFLSKRKSKHKSLRYLGLLGLIMLFEFISYFIHPFISLITNKEPILILMASVGLGAVLVPFHHRLETWVENKLVTHKKQNIRQKDIKIKNISKK